MTMFPSSLISFSTKSNGQTIDASDVNSPQNEITALETKVGIDNSGDTTSLDYLIKNAASGGGGHVQAANVGGTGQTSFNKGDTLVASSSSVISKLAVGTDGLFLNADSSQSAGVGWASPSKIQNLASVISIRSVSETSILSATIGASVLGSSNALNATMFVNNFSATGSVLVKATFGGAVVGSVMAAPGSPSSIYGTVQYTLFANANPNLQRGILRVNLNDQHNNPAVVNSVLTLNLYDMNVASVATATAQVMGVTVRMSNAGNNDHIDVDATTVGKIV